eukprot:577922-Amphidinium_carterae.1
MRVSRAHAEGFAELTGYCEQELIGRSSRILLERVIKPPCDELSKIRPRRQNGPYSPNRNDYITRTLIGPCHSCSKTSLVQSS